MVNKYLITMLPVLLLFTYGCGSDANKSYVSESEDHCQEILFTCPQFQEGFYDEDGCGCIEYDGEDQPESRRLKNLIENYLTIRALDPKHDGVILSTFIFLDATEDASAEVGVNLNYQIWAGMNEYYVEAGLVKTEKLFNGPMILDIAETGKNYIINGNELFEVESKEAIEQNFTENSYNWIFDTEGESLEAKKNRVEESLRQQALSVFGGNLE